MTTKTRTERDGRAGDRVWAVLLQFMFLATTCSALAQTPTLKKEYIYINGKLVAIEIPASTAPTAITNPATGVTSGAATLNGTVNPNGLATTVHFDWGTTTAYGNATGNQAIGSGTAPVTVTAAVTGLVAGQTYHFRVVATSTAGSGTGSDISFAVQTLPTATTAAASSVTSNAAVLNGTVNPNALNTTAHFEWGTTTAYGNSTADQSVGSGTTAQAVSGPLTGLVFGQTYHFRLVGINSAGTATGSDFSFTAQEIPTVTTAAATSITSNGAVLNGTVNPHGLATTAHFEWGTTTAYGNTTANQAISGTTAQAVSASLMGLSPNQTYHFRLVASNGAGPATADDLVFTTSPPCSCTISPTSKSMGAGGGNDSVSVSAASDCSWTATSQDQWLTITAGSSGTGNGAVAYSVAANPNPQSRTGHITIQGVTFTLTQDGNANVPAVTTSGAVFVSSCTATLTGSVNPNGSNTQAHYEWGSSTAYGNSTPEQNVGMGTSAVSVTALITNLSPSTTYHYRLVATNDAGNGTGGDATLTTQAGNPCSIPTPEVTAVTSAGDGMAHVFFRAIPSAAMWISDYYIEMNPGVSGPSLIPTQSGGYLPTSGTNIAWTGAMLDSSIAHTYRVQAKVGSDYGPFGNMVTLPAIPANLSPANGATGVAFSPTLSWSAAAGATSYNIYLGTTSDPPLVTTVTGTSYAASGLSPVTTYYWKVEAVNGVGKDAVPVQTFTTINDTTAPTISITLPTSNPTYVTTTGSLNMSGAASDNVGVTQVTWTNSAGGQGTASGKTSWSITGITLQAGPDVITVKAWDAAGNYGSAVLNVTFSSDNPTVGITTPPTGQTYSTTGGSLTLVGTAADVVGLSQVTWSNDRGGSGTASGTTSWSVPSVALQIGSNVITVTAVNTAGRSGSTSVTVSFDPVAPSIGITSPTTGPTYSTSTSPLTIGGAASDNIGVTQVTWINDRGGNGTASGSTSWTASGIALQSGTNNITVTARDAAGNSASASLTVSYTPPDSTAPIIAITSPTSAPTYYTGSSPIDIAGTASDNVGVTTVTWTNSLGGSGTALGTTSWSIGSVMLYSGTNVITVTASDAAGNHGTAQISVTYTPAGGIVRPELTYVWGQGWSATLYIRVLPATDTTISSFEVEQNPGAYGQPSIIQVAGCWAPVTGNNIAWTQYGLDGNTVYTWRVRAIVNGVTGEFGNMVTMPATPSNISPANGATGIALNPTLTWSATAGATSYEVYLGTSSSPPLVATVTGTSYTATGLSGGTTYYWKVQARNGPGRNPGAVWSFGTLAVDMTAPTATITSPTSSQTYSTSTSPLNLGGIASDNVGVTQVTWSNSRSGSGTASGTTSWSVAGITLQSGINIITVTARDAAGNVGSAVLTVTCTPPDTTAPAVTITSPTTSATYNTSMSSLNNIGGTATDNVGITQVSWANDRGGNGTASGTTNWSVSSITLQSGNNIVTVTARDAAGNTGSAVLTVVYTPPDTTAPTVTITSPTTAATYSTNNSSLSLGGTASDNVGATQVTWSNDRGGSGAASGAATWAVSSIALQGGVNVITISAGDAANNVGSTTLTVTYTPLDTTAPTVSITSPTTGTTYATSTGSITLGGTASDNVGVTQVTWSNDRGGSGTASGTTTWSVAGVALQSGMNVITMTVRDAAGNTGTAALTVTYTPSDTTAPTVSITSPTAGPTYATSTGPINVGGTASDNVGVTQVTWVNDRGGNGTAAGTTGWSVSGVTLQSGINVITVTVRDQAGNTGSAVLTVTYTPPDTMAPTVSITIPTSGATYATSTASLSLGGTASDNVGVTQVTWTNDRGGGGTASGTTSWSAPGITLQTGPNVVTVTARDAAGNAGSAILTVTYTPPDTTAPTISITSPTTSSTYSTNTSPISIGGTASDNVGVTQVTWSNSAGGSGNASGTTSWSVSGIVLQSGTNVITAAARDAAGNTGSATLTVTYTPPDTTPPTVAITSPTTNPTYGTSTNTLNIAGTASDNVGVTQVTWSNSTGGSGTASGTTSWSVSGIALVSGTNVITVSARDAAANIGTATLTVTYTPPPDTTPPTIAIASPTTSPTYSTSSSTLNLGGTASDNVAVTLVTWVNSGVGSGTASGTTGWNVSGIGLQTGTNIVTVTARDAAGNTSTATLTVTYTPPGPRFTDDPLVPQVTPIKAQHVMELRQTITNIRTQYGMSVPVWTDSSLSGVVIKAIHIQELRDRLNEVLAYTGRGLPNYTDPSLVSGATAVKAVHIQEIRQVIVQAGW